MVNGRKKGLIWYFCCVFSSVFLKFFLKWIFYIVICKSIEGRFIVFVLKVSF